MSDLLLDQFSRLLDGLPANDPWPVLSESGFLDVLRPEEDGGAALPLEELFPLAMEVGRRERPPRILEAMAARLVEPEATEVADLEATLVGGGLAASQARALAATLAAGQMAGAMTRLQDMTVEYAQTRKQFGREIGKFQAIQHQIAVLSEEVMAARMAAQTAFVGPPLEVSVRLAGVAKLRAGRAAEPVSAIAHAVHGAIGVSLEHSLHHYTSRLRALRMAYGGESWWARELGDWVLGDARDITTLARAL
ncbi:MAG: hypothetical protein JWQ29_1165 [Phenylobacterium sp.]|nr:hypothetical protein [Phenylobacterium sp.]